MTLAGASAAAVNGPPALPTFCTHPGFLVPAATDIVAGYGEALYRLGLRYEVGVGWKHHPGEAVRCFAKSARLGNAKALEHLAEVAVPS
jgi:TPR repeat protein